MNETMTTTEANLRGGLRTALLSGVCAALLSACSASPYENTPQDIVQAPGAWAETTSMAQVQNGWLGSLQNEQLNKLVVQALQHNQALGQQALDVDIQAQQLRTAGSSLWPNISAGLTQRRSDAGAGSSAVSSASLSLDMTYELDVWGRLSASERAANLRYLSAQASFEEARQQLVGQVVSAWVGVIEANKLLALFQQRVENAKENQSIIEAGYRRGLNSALDVYLVRNELNTELARTANQAAIAKEAVRSLERLLGKYPTGNLPVEADIPAIEGTVPLGLPADMIFRKPSLQASWNNLLASDANLAFAHKARLPNLNLVGSLSTTGENPSNFFSDSLGWSLLGNVTAPIFNAGRLKAAEESARLELEKAEIAYMEAVYNAYQLVENAVTREASLKARGGATEKARENAVIAARLSFEQYQKGLVSYTTVLDAQNRSYDAQAAAIQIQSELVANRVRLHLALGGDFENNQTDAEDL